MSQWEQRGFLEAVTLKPRLKVNRSCSDIGVKVKRQLLGRRKGSPVSREVGCGRDRAVPVA